MKIKIPILKVALLITLATSLSAQTPLGKEQQALQQTVIRFFDALTLKDSIALKKHSTPDIVLYEHGKIWNMDSLILKAITLTTDTAFKRSNRFEFLQATTRKGIGWISYNLFSEVTLTDKKVNVHFQETVVAIKEKGRWKIKVLHSTVIKRDYTSS